jgi:UDP-glucose 4-epimerase
MRNLITGGAGFIGSHLAEHLLGLGQEVVVADNLSTGRFENIRHLVGREGFAYNLADVDEPEQVAHLIDDADCVYHLAAAVGVRLIIDDPVHTIETNIRGTRTVLQRAARTGKRVLLASTSEVYGKSSQCPYREDDDTTYGATIRNRWSYAFSKAIDEFLFLAYHEKYGLPGVVVRLFNTVGPRQVGHYGMVVPRFIEQALRGGPICVYGDGEQSRCFAHVADVVPAMHALLHAPAATGRIVNLGSDQEVTINALAERIRDHVGPQVAIRHVPYAEAYRPGFEDMRRRVPSLDRARELIGYTPQFDLDRIITDVLADARQRLAEA